MPLLEVDDIHTYYGNIEALKGISLDRRRGRDRHADRLQRRRQVDHAALDLRAHAAARGHDPLRRRGHHAACRRRRSSSWASRSRPRAALLPAHDRAREPRAWAPTCAATSASARTWSASSTLFPRLKERERQKAGTMSGGEQQMLAIGRALMAQPKLLLLDEPSMGIAPILVDRIYETDRRDQQAGHDDPARRAERELRARRLAARLRARDGRGRAVRRVGQRCRRTPTSRRPTSGMTDRNP